jgi:hypothetical protein
VWEVVDNAVDEAMAGHCDLIEVILSTGDNGCDVVTVSVAYISTISLFSQILLIFYKYIFIPCYDI